MAATTPSTKSPAYDANGNVTDDGERTYKWDAEDRLISVTSKTQPSRVTTFRYDGQDRRIVIVVNGNETRYLWCGDSICQARTAADLVSRRYYPEGELIPAGGTQLYYAQDHLGSVRDVMAVQNGSRVASFDYDPYGSTDFRYAGMLYEQSSGLYLTYYRVYDSRTARWLSRDPLQEDGGVNLYGYVAADPIGWYDLLGLAKLGDIVFFNWKNTNFPEHSAIVTKVDNNGNAVSSFGGWGDTMTFHEADLLTYNNGVQSDIIGYGDMTGLTSQSLPDYMKQWSDTAVAPDWDGSKGKVCVDATTSKTGWGGDLLRQAMTSDFKKNPSVYSLTPNNSLFFRRNSNLQRFFIDTNRYDKKK